MEQSSTNQNSSGSATGELFIVNEYGDYVLFENMKFKKDGKIVDDEELNNIAKLFQVKENAKRVNTEPGRFYLDIKDDVSDEDLKGLSVVCDDGKEIKEIKIDEERDKAREYFKKHDTYDFKQVKQTSKFGFGLSIFGLVAGLGLFAAVALVPFTGGASLGLLGPLALALMPNAVTAVALSGISLMPAIFSFFCTILSGKSLHKLRKREEKLKPQNKKSKSKKSEDLELEDLSDDQTKTRDKKSILPSSDEKSTKVSLTSSENKKSTLKKIKKNKESKKNKQAEEI